MSDRLAVGVPPVVPPLLDLVHAIVADTYFGLEADGLSVSLMGFEGALLRLV